MQPGIWQENNKSCYSVKLQRYFRMPLWKQQKKEIKTRFFIGTYKAVKKKGGREGRGNKENTKWAEAYWQMFSVVMLKPKYCYEVAEELAGLAVSSVLGSFVSNDLLLQKIYLEWAKLWKLWWGGCCSLPQFRDSFCCKIICQGAGWIQMSVSATFLLLHTFPVLFL